VLFRSNGPVNDFSDVVFLPTYGGRAVDINDNNMIVGTTANNTRVTPVIYSRAFVYDYNTSSDNLFILPVLEGGLHSHAYDINENNDVVGYSESAAGNHAVIWAGTGEVTDLHTLMAAEGWVLTSATAINDNGDIAGTGTLNGMPHGFLLSNGTISGPPPAPNQLPVAVASADVYSGKAPLVVTFDSSASTDTDGAIATDGYSWDFMDGSVSTEANPSHEFTTPGTYQVTLTVTDDQGATASDSITITVRKGKRK